ncbi:MAG: hypothetical protein KatS3mg076_0738 [Candidatus Binatia bacterium]|nr:MAG: hypothetical protein KatS3mg076_0738 [Candidatus Binatia bacterium]
MAGGGRTPAEPGESGARERRHRKRELVVLGSVGLLFGALAFLETRTGLWEAEDKLVGNVLFFVLINLNLILLILLLFLSLRSFVRLVLDRRRGVLGSRLRTRLVLAFVAFTLVPTAVLLAFAQGFLGKAFDFWFDLRIERALEEALETAQSVYQERGDRALEKATRIGEELRKFSGRTEALEARLEELRKKEGLRGLWLLGREGEERLVSSGRLEAEEVPGLAAALEREGRWVSSGRKGRVVRAAVHLGPEGPWKAVVVELDVPAGLRRGLARVADTYRTFRELEVLRRPMKNSYFLSLSLVTLVVVFTASWFGFRLARSVTGPIQRVAEGTREVAQGNWGYRIEQEGDDELATLVRSFNSMTAQLEEMHARLEERHRYIRAVVAHVSIGVVSIDARGIVRGANPAAQNLLGLGEAQLVGKPWREAFGRGETQGLGDLLASVRPGACLSSRQLRLRSGPGAPVVRATARLLADEEGRSLGTVLLLEDVSQALRIQRMEAWREVARRIAHEIKNPLTPIQLSAQRLRRRLAPRLAGEERAVLEDCTSTIVRQVEDLERLVDSFARFARLPTAERSPVELNRLVEETVALFREAHPDVVFALEVDPRLPVVALDREAVRRVLVNLLDNAVGACREPGAARPPVVAVTTELDSNLQVVRLVVADNGCGVPEEIRHRLFEPYVSTKPGGTGLGLAIVSAIAADHRGYVRWTENVPRGSRFVVEFPLRESEEKVAV